MECEHRNFTASVAVARITHGDGGQVYRYQADVRVNCVDCGLPFRFIGLPAGLDLDGAATSVDALEARLAIAPKGEVLSEIEGTPIGFSIRRE